MAAWNYCRGPTSKTCIRLHKGEREGLCWESWDQQLQIILVSCLLDAEVCLLKNIFRDENHHQLQYDKRSIQMKHLALTLLWIFESCSRFCTSPSLTSISCCCSRTWNLFIKQHQQQACKNRHYTIINNVADSSDTRQLFNVFCVSLFLSVQSSILKFFSVGDWYKLSLLMLEIFKLASEQGKHIMDFNGSEFPCFSLVLGRASVQWWRSVINSATVSRNRKYK